MNPEIKTRWVAALRSGNYRQGKKKLAQQMTRTMPMTHCCLGVLCELAVEDGIIEAMNHPSGASGQVRYFGGPNNWKATALPPAVSEWAGFGDERDSLRSDPKLLSVSLLDFRGQSVQRAVSCSEANDGNTVDDVAPRTFEQIADLIKENL